MLRRRYRATRVHGIEARDVEAQRTHPQVCANLGTCAVLPTTWSPGKVDRAPVPLERTLGVVGLLSGCRPLRLLQRIVMQPQLPCALYAQVAEKSAQRRVTV